MTVKAVRSWITDPDSGALIPVFSAHEARILIDHLDYRTAAADLSEEDYRVFREAQAKLVLLEQIGKQK